MCTVLCFMLVIFSSDKVPKDNTEHWKQKQNPKRNNFSWLMASVFSPWQFGYIVFRLLWSRLAWSRHIPKKSCSPCCGQDAERQSGAGKKQSLQKTPLWLLPLTPLPNFHHILIRSSNYDSISRFSWFRLELPSIIHLSLTGYSIWGPFM